jgi:hypothetical protein
MILNDIVIVKLPEEIILELENWKFHCDLIKNHPLSYLKQHDNFGKNTNAYQVSVPANLIENSFWLPYTLRLCEQIFKEKHRNFFLRKWDGHFDGYDLWINYSYKGNYNPKHNHAGFLSGVIYLNNQNDKTIFTEKNFDFVGTKGDMIIFPSKFYHEVPVQQDDYERVTFAFNINKKQL